MEKYLINPDQKIATISKDIYGHFSEHLGRCIYDGLFVGKDSSIPNVNGMRTDVVNALKEMGIPVRLVGVGEGIDDMQSFSAEDFVKALFE